MDKIAFKYVKNCFLSFGVILTHYFVIFSKTPKKTGQKQTHSLILRIQ